MNAALLGNSLGLAALATLLAVGWGLMMALFVCGLPQFWQRFFAAVAIIAAALPPFVVTNTWLFLLGAMAAPVQGGVFGAYTIVAAAWVLGMMLWPIAFLAFWSAWRELEPALLESDLAVTGSTLVRHVLWPLSRNMTGQAAGVIFVLSLGNFGVPAVMQAKVLSAEVWIRFSTLFDSWGALRLSLPLVIAALLLLAWLQRGEIAWPRLRLRMPPDLFRQQLGRGVFVLAGVFGVFLCVLSAGLPLAQILASGRTWRELPGAMIAGRAALWNSFLWSIISASVVIAISLLLGGFGKVKRDGRSVWLGQRALQGVAWVPFLIPGVLIGICLIAVLNRPGLDVLYRSAAVVILAWAIRYIGPGWQWTSAALRSADPRLAELGILDNLNWWQRMRHVALPQTGRRIFIGWYIIFVLCLWDVESMILVTPPGGETLALRIFNLLHYGHNSQVDALCLTLLLLAVLPLVMAVFVVLLSRRAALGTFFAGPGAALVAAIACAGCSRSGGTEQLNGVLFVGAQVLGHRGVGIGEFNKPRSVAVDEKDCLYAVDMTGRVQKFSANGQFQISWQMPQTDLGKPKGMCRGHEGEIIVIEPHYQRVNHYGADGRLIRQWGKRGTAPGEFMLPRAVAVNSAGEIFVSEYGASERVQRFSPGGTNFLNGFGHAGTGPGEFNRPEGICVDSHDNLYVADSCNHRIQVFTREGRFLRAHGSAGSARGELSYPYDICVDSAGRQYVCEFGNSRIQVFDSKDEPIEIIGGPGDGPGRFNNPWAIAMDSKGNLYVADSLNHRVQKLLRRAETALNRRPAA